MKKNKIAVMMTLIIFCLTIVLGCSSQKINFKKEFSEYEGEDWCKFADDGSWMRVNTNPNDVGITQDVIGLGLYLEIELENIVAQLGFPDSVYQNEVLGTSQSDGMKEAETDDIKMSWSYSDEKGLEILFENK